ncbi:hypothetical protein C8Q77DRAFT_1099950 [Trametes polyzona]|nr:hypothetical protein C8Q77DRAFT_1099950 [Trametes polyzona]
MATTGSNALDMTIGVIFVGFLATGCLFGVTTAQTVWYFRHYPNDRRVLRLLVVTIWLLDAVHLGLYLVTMFIYLVYKKGAYFGQEPLPWTSNAQLLCNAFAIALIQSFYASRIWTLSRRKLLLVVMSLFIAATWVCSVVLFLKSILTDTVADYVSLVPFDIALSAMSASTDVLLCSALVILLASARTGTVGANRLINKLMLYTVHTGLLTSVNATLSLIFVITLPRSSIFVMFYYIGARLYSVSLLGTLNARARLRMQAQNMGQFSLPDIQITEPGSPKRSLSESLSRPHQVDLSVQCDTPSTFGSISTDATRVFCDGHRCYVLPPDVEFGIWQAHLDFDDNRIGTRTAPVEIADPMPPCRTDVRSVSA